MKKLLILLMVVICTGAALAEDAPDSDYYIGLLAEATKSGTDDQAKLDAAYAHFDGLEPSSRNAGLKMYIEALRMIALNDWERLPSSLLILSWSVHFIDWLEQNDTGIPAVSALSAYAKGRESEANGDYEQALKAYDNCAGEFDIPGRVAQMVVTPEAKYELACRYMMEGHYVDALTLFEQLAEGDYMDSRDRVGALRVYLDMPAYEPTPTPTPTPAPTHTPAPTPTPTPAPVSDDAKKADQASAVAPMPTATAASGAAKACSHGNTKWTTTKEATCADKGARVKTCRNCGKQLKTESLSALGHAFKAQNTVAATCTQQGYTIYKCSRCSAAKNDNPVNARGHSYGAWAAVSNSNDQRKCSRCGNTETRAITWSGWSNWSTTQTSAITGSRQVETKQETQTTYTYTRWYYYNTSANAYWSSYTKYEGTYYKQGTGSWQTKTTASPLPTNGSADGRTRYMSDGSTFDDRTWWNQKVNTTTATYYRYKTRTN